MKLLLHFKVDPPCSSSLWAWSGGVHEAPTARSPLQQSPRSSPLQSLRIFFFHLITLSPQPFFAPIIVRSSHSFSFLVWIQLETVESTVSPNSSSARVLSEP